MPCLLAYWKEMRVGPFCLGHSPDRANVSVRKKRERTCIDIGDGRGRKTEERSHEGDVGPVSHLCSYQERREREKAICLIVVVAVCMSLLLLLCSIRTSFFNYSSARAAFGVACLHLTNIKMYDGKTKWRVGVGKNRFFVLSLAFDRHRYNGEERSECIMHAALNV